MGIGVKVGSVYKTVSKMAYKIGSTYYIVSRGYFFDPISQEYKEAFIANNPPADPTNMALSFTGASGTSNYVASISWTQNADPDDNAVTNQFVRESTPVATTDTFSIAAPATGSRSTTRNIFGNDTNITYGSSQVRYRMRVVDAEGSASNYANTPYLTVPPLLPTSPSITSTTLVGEIPVPTFSWVRTTANNTVDNYVLNITIGASNSTEVVSGANSSFTPTASTGYAGGDSVSVTIQSRSTQNSTTTNSPTATSSVSFVTPPVRPASISISSSSNSSITWGWTAPSTGNYTTTYTLVVRRFTSASVFTDTEYSVTGTSYTYAIPDATYAVEATVYSNFSGKRSLNGRSVLYGVVPPTATVASPTVSGGTPSASWSYANATNISSQRIFYRVGTGAYSSADLASTARAYTFPISGQSGVVNDFYIVSFSLFTSAQSAAATSTTPVTPTSVSGRFTSGDMIVTWTGDAVNTSYDVYYYNSVGTLILTRNVVHSGTSMSYTTGSSASFAINTKYYTTVIGRNASGTGFGSTGGLKKKIANPYVITPTSAYGFKPGLNSADLRWDLNDLVQGAVDVTQVSSGQDEERIGFYFYGTKVADEVSPSALGYSLTGNGTSILMKRDASGGSSSGRAAYFTGHRYTSAPTSVTTTSGISTTSSAGTPVGSFAQGAAAWVTLPSGLTNSLLTSILPITGIALRTGETSTTSSVSTNYAGWAGIDENSGGVVFGTLSINHNG